MEGNFPDVVLRAAGSGRRCKVVYSYDPQNEDELKLQEDDEIIFLSEVEEGWWRGKLNGKTGVFPSNFVVELPPSEEPSLSDADISAPLSSPEEVPQLPPKPIREQCRVFFPYEAAIEDELTLVEGDVITIITKDVADKGWWKGELNGKIGLFPDNFVEIITPVEEAANRHMQKKPDRPAKNLPPEIKPDSKIPLISSLAAGVPKKNEIEATNNAINETAAKRKSADLGIIKPDTVASHRKSLEEKVANEAGKKPLRPPVSGKPKPPAAANKPTSVKRQSAEINDLVDGALASKIKLERIDLEHSDDLDLDSVSRTDMLSHITTSRPRAPGRRPPSSSNNKENEGTNSNSVLTNGSSPSDVGKLEISPKEKQKQHLPFMDELKVNLKSTKPALDPPIQPNSNSTAVNDKKPFNLWGSKVSSSQESSSSLTTSMLETNHNHSMKAEMRTNSTSTAITKNADLRQTVPPKPVVTSATVVASKVSDLRHSSTTNSVSSKVSEFSSATNSVSAKISELSSVFDERNKIAPSMTTSDLSHDSSTRKEVNDLKIKVERLEQTVSTLVQQLREEADKRRLIEKELNKLTDLVTQV